MSERSLLGPTRRGRSLRAALLLPVLAAVLVGCSSPVVEGPPASADPLVEASEPAPAEPSPSPSPDAPGGLYVGFYQEDRDDNPEDPMPGSYYLWLPDESGPFSGAMSYTYIGCQDTNVGTVDGVKSSLLIDGEWAGSVDEVRVGGTYSGSYDEEAERFSGKYQNAEGKVHVVVESCIEYHVASFGRFEMSAPGAKDPDTFDVDVEGSDLAWGEVDGAAWYLVGIYDVTAAREGRQAIVGQTLVPAGSTAIGLGSLGMTGGGGEHVVAVSAFSAGGDRLGYTSRAWNP